MPCIGFFIMERNALFRELVSVCPRILEEIRPVEFARGEQIAASGSRIPSIIFPDAGLLVRAISFEDGSRIATSMIGNWRGFGLSAALGSDWQLTDCFVLMGGAGWCLSVSSLRRLADHHPELRTRLSQHEHVVAAQSQQWAACATTHSARQRVVTFLDRMMAHSGALELTITQDQAAELLCLRRPTLSAIAHSLRNDGLVDYTRGRIVISSHSALLAAACPCCAALRDQDGLLSNSTSGGRH
jgi:CRP-like cAMP-binding protein